MKYDDCVTGALLVMEITPIVRPENSSEATRWDDAISSLWFYLLGPGYSAKTEDISISANPIHVMKEFPMDKRSVILE